METISDFEDLLTALHHHRVRYLIIGGFAFIYHAKPRFTKDMDLWIDPAPRNIARANAALAEFGSPYLLDSGNREQILQLGLPPNRIDFLQSVGTLDFGHTWEKRERGAYGHVMANWIDLDSLLAIKENIPDPRHQIDAECLRKVRAEKKRKSAGKKALGGIGGA